MLDNDIRHVPVVSARGEVLGVIVGIDLVAAEAHAPFMLRRAIGEAETAEEQLRGASDQLNPMVVALHGAGLGAAQISAIISVVADALVRRMIEIAVKSAGLPPGEFAWIALGSHGRREAVPSSDVDSGMAWAETRTRADGSGANRVTGRRRRSAATCTRSRRRSPMQRSVGWRLDPHGVTAAGSFSASSIGEWRRQSALAGPSQRRTGPDRDLDPARRADRLRARARTRREGIACSKRVIAPPSCAGC